MKTQSCISAQNLGTPRSTRLRAGFTDVLSIGIVIRWIRVSIRPTVRPVKPTVIDRRLVLAITNTNNAVNTISVSDRRAEPEAPGHRASAASGEP